MSVLIAKIFLLFNFWPYLFYTIFEGVLDKVVTYFLEFTSEGFKHPVIINNKYLHIFVSRMTRLISSRFRVFSLYLLNHYSYCELCLRFKIILLTLFFFRVTTIIKGMRICIAVRITPLIAVQGRFYLSLGRYRDFPLRPFSWYVQRFGWNTDAPFSWYRDKKTN